jgi:predicted nucleotidyltransferase
MIGVTAKQKSLLRDLLLRHVPDTEVWVFGSRVRGPVKDSSDLDLALYPKKTLSMSAMGLLQEALSEALLPFRVDCVDTTSITPEFRAIIEQSRQRFI